MPIYVGGNQAEADTLGLVRSCFNDLGLSSKIWNTPTEGFTQGIVVGETYEALSPGGYNASDTARAVQAGERRTFQRTGTSTYLDLGDSKAVVLMPKINDLSEYVETLDSRFVTPMSVGSPQPAPDGTGDWSIGLQWALDQSAPMILPPGIYQTKVPLEFSKLGIRKEIWIQAGAVLRAHASFSAGVESSSNLGSVLWARTPAGGSATSYTDGGRIWGSGTIDCNGVALRGVNLRYARYHITDGISITNCPLVGVHVGSNTTAGSISIENKVQNVRVYTPEWVNGVGTIGINDANSIGIHFENCTDCRVISCQPVGFRTGAKLSAATKAIDLHPWTIAKYGPMTRGIDLVGVCTLIGCYADTPTTLGVLGSEKAYGIYVRTAAGASVLINPEGWLADTADSLTAGVDNDAYFIYSESNSSPIKIVEAVSGSANSSKKWIDTLGSSDNSVLLNNIEIVGAASQDGRFYSNSLNWNLRRNIGANFFPTRTDRTTASGSVTLSVSSSSRQRFTAALTADVTITLPSAPSGVCLEYHFIRASTATGAFNILIKNASGTTIATLSAAATRCVVGCDSSGNWTAIGGDLETSSDSRLIYAKQYGVKADGTTDDTAAINAAIAALTAISGSYTPASTFELILPPGRMITQGGHILPSGVKVRVRGSGAYTTILYLKSASNSFGLELQGQFSSVEHLQIDGNRTNNPTGLEGLRISAAHCLADRVYVANTSGDGIVVGYGASAINSRLRAVDVRFCKGYGVNVSGSYSTTDCQFTDVNVGTSGKSGFNLASAAQKMVNCHSWGNGIEDASDNSGFRMVSGGHMLVGCESETNIGRGIYIGSGLKGISIVGGTIWGNASTGIYAFGASYCVLGGISLRNNGSSNSAGSSSLAFANIFLDNCVGMTTQGCSCYDDGSSIPAGSYTSAPTYPFSGRSNGVFTVSRHYAEGTGSNNNIISGNNMPASLSRSGVAITNVGSANRYNGNITGDTTIGTVASASTITIPAHNELIQITGTTTITSITAAVAGKRITLLFSGICQVTAGSNLLIGSDYTSTSGGTFSLICDGTNWYRG